MSLWDSVEMRQQLSLDELTRKLLDFYESEVKITKEEMAECRRLVMKYVESLVNCCREISPLPILPQPGYTGSMYEGLKAEAADEVDLMVALEPGSNVRAEYTWKKGFVRFRATGDSKLLKYANRDGYIIPDSFVESFFYGLVKKVAEKFNDKISESSDISFIKVRRHGPAVQLDLIKEEQKQLSVDLVACFKTENGKYFVPKSYVFPKSLCIRNPELLWRQSFSLEEKQKLKNIHAGTCSLES